MIGSAPVAASNGSPDAKVSAEADAGLPPSDEQLAQRPGGMRFDRAEKCWLWTDPERRQWQPRPNTPQVVAAAIRTWNARLVARKIGVSIQTIYALAGGFSVLSITMIGVSHQLHLLADIGEELAP